MISLGGVENGTGVKKTKGETNEDNVVEKLKGKKERGKKDIPK